MITINDDCINCSACASECPVDAVNEPGENIEFANKILPPISNEHFFIISQFCTECYGLKEFKCITICPMNAIEKY